MLICWFSGPVFTKKVGIFMKKTIAGDTNKKICMH